MKPYTHASTHTASTLANKLVQQTKCILVKNNVEDPNPHRHKRTHFRQWLMSFCCFCVVPHLLPRGLQHEPETIWSIWPITQCPVTSKYTYTHTHTRARFWPHYAGGQPRFVPEHPLWHTHTRPPRSAHICPLHSLHPSPPLEDRGNLQTIGLTILQTTA